MKEEYLCEFRCEFFPHIQEVDASVLKDPVAHSYYDEQRDNFTYDINATDRINRQLKAAYARHRQAKKNEQITGHKPAQ